MRMEVLLPILFSFPSGLAFFIALTRNWNAHLKGLLDKLAFFFWPYPPERMLVIQELDGEINIYYDNDYEEIQSENKTLIKTVDGQEYVTEIPPSESSITVSMFDAKAPSGYQSPFGIAWRWMVAASILIYFVYFALVTAWIPPVTVVQKIINGIAVEIAQQAQLDPFEALVSTTAFFSLLTWLLSNIMRMNDRTVSYAWYHAKGINPPDISIIPIPGISSTGLLEYLEKLGRDVKVVVPKESAEVVQKTLDEVKKKVGSRSLAAIILAKLAIAKTWRQALAQVLRERFDMRKAGEASAMIRLGIEPVSKRIIPIAMLVFIIGLGVGYWIGNTYGFGVVPAVNQTSTNASIQHPPFNTVTNTAAPSSPTPSPASPPTATPTSAPHTTSPGLTPAKPPAPPTATSVGGVKP